MPDDPEGGDAGKFKGNTARPPAPADAQIPAGWTPCPTCTVATPVAQFCTSCGEPLVKKKFCAGCGHELKPGGNFCEGCGGKVTA